MAPFDPREDLPARRRSGAARRWAAVGLSLAVHACLVVALLRVVIPASPPQPPPVTVALIPAPTLAPAAPDDPAPAAAAKVVTAPPQAVTPAHRPPVAPLPEVRTIAAGKPQAALTQVSAAELAGAATADGSGAGGNGGTASGAGGGACNMLRRLQAALRRDQLVLAAARTPETAGKAVKVWDGDWVQSSGEDGKGLAAVREAIMWEVAFAPAACRAQAVHGLVLISLNDGSGATRLALGAEDWRWSDLLGASGGGVR